MTPWAVAYQAPPSMGFSRQGYWSGDNFLQGIFLTQGLNPDLPHCGQTFSLSHGEARHKSGIEGKKEGIEGGRKNGSSSQWPMARASLRFCCFLFRSQNLSKSLCISSGASAPSMEALPRSM